MTRIVSIMVIAFILVLLGLITNLNFEFRTAELDKVRGFTDIRLSKYFTKNAEGRVGLDPYFQILEKVDGKCESASRLSERHDAFTCVTDKGELDPCYASTDAVSNEFACTNTPWDNHIILLKSTMRKSKRDVHFNLLRSAPFGVELEDGNRCIKNLAANEHAFNGLVASYICLGKETQRYLYGDIIMKDDMFSIMADAHSSLVAKRKIKAILH
jgi:hypothetical protein